MEEGLSYDDVLLKPKKTSVTSLSDVDTSTKLAGIELETPLISAAMDTVTERTMAEEMAEHGGMGAVHRFIEPEKQAEMVEGVNPVAAAIGLNEFERAEKLAASNVNLLVADIAHGHHTEFINFIEKLVEKFDIPVCAGNVATEKGAKDLAKAGADIVKVGIGPGSACETRQMTGAGVPQLSAVEAASKANAQIIADGGIRKPGDLVKAFMAGADAGMAGGILADTFETPRGGEYRGMSTKAAAEDRTDRELKESDHIEEGEEISYEEKRSVKKVLRKYQGGLKSGISYCGAHNLGEARKNAEFVRVSNTTQYRNAAHGDTLDK